MIVQVGRGEELGILHGIFEKLPSLVVVFHRSSLRERTAAEERSWCS